LSANDSDQRLRILFKNLSKKNFLIRGIINNDMDLFFILFWRKLRRLLLCLATFYNIY